MMASKRVAMAVAAVLLSASSAVAETVADFYKGKTIEILVGAAAGGGYDIAGRAVARYIGRHIPGQPAIVVKNIPGSASVRMTNHLYNVAPQDGTVIGMPNNNLPYEQRLRLMSTDGSNLHFDVAKMHWIGTPIQEPQVLWVWHGAPARTVEDLKKTEILMGATAVAADNASQPRLLNAMLGTKMKVVAGYKGQADIFIAIERGEVQGNTTGVSNLFVHKGDWMKEGKIRVLVQLAVDRAPEFRNVPTAVELAASEADRELLRVFLLKYKMTRPLAMAPGVPADRAVAMRAAFDATMKDPDYIAEATRIGLGHGPLSGAEVEALVKQVQAMPQPLADRLRALLVRSAPSGKGK